MATKKKKLDEPVSSPNLSFKRHVPNNGILWMGRIVDQHGDKIRVEATIDATGIRLVVDATTQRKLDLDGLKSLNKGNVLFNPAMIQELWQRYGFTKRNYDSPHYT
jgi:hypothetical protein